MLRSSHVLGGSAMTIFRQHVFSKDPVKNFAEYATLPCGSFKTVTCMAHNAKGFDFQYLTTYANSQTKTYYEWDKNHAVGN